MERLIFWNSIPPKLHRSESPRRLAHSSFPRRSNPLLSSSFNHSYFLTRQPIPIPIPIPIHSMDSVNGSKPHPNPLKPAASHQKVLSFIFNFGWVFCYLNFQLLNKVTTLSLFSPFCAFRCDHVDQESI